MTTKLFCRLALIGTFYLITIFLVVNPNGWLLLAQIVTLVIAIKAWVPRSTKNGRTKDEHLNRKRE